MNAILDTHLLVWWLLDAPALRGPARALIENRSSRILVSAASLWELAIKRSRGKIRLDLDDLPAVIERDDFELLSIRPEHALRVAGLPWHHADPFDRMLIAQAKAEGCVLLTADAALCVYGEAVRRV